MKIHEIYFNLNFHFLSMSVSFAQTLSFPKLIMYYATVFILMRNLFFNLWYTTNKNIYSLFFSIKHRNYP